MIKNRFIRTAFPQNSGMKIPVKQEFITGCTAERLRNGNEQERKSAERKCILAFRRFQLSDHVLTHQRRKITLLWSLQLPQQSPRLLQQFPQGAPPHHLRIPG